MSTLPQQRNIGVLITIGLAVVGAIVAGFILFSSGKASEVDLSTARLVPADASLYFAINTDLSSDQWVAAFKLIERLGTEDPQGELEDAVNESADWEDDVVPFLGGDAAFFLRSTQVSFTDVDGAIVFKAKDAEAALDVIREQSGVEFESDDYGDHEYWASDGLYAVVLGEHLALATAEDVLFDVIDAADGKIANLTSVQDFKTLRDELTRNFLGFWYMDSGSLFEDVLESDGGLMRTAMEEAGIADVLLKPSAFAFGAKTDSFEAQSASLGEPGAIGPATTPAESRFAGLVPGETAFFFSTHGIAQAYDAMLEGAGDDIDDAVRENSEFDDLDEALEAAGETIGLESARDIIDQLTGESAFAIWFPTGVSEETEGVFLAEVEDEDAARDILESIIESSNGSGLSEGTVNGVEVTSFIDEDGDEIAFAITDGYLLIGTPDGVEAVIEPDGPRLSEMDTYRDTVEAMPTKLGSYAYFDIATLLGLEEAGIVPTLGDSEKALRGAIINYVNERDVVRSSAVITIAE